VGVALSSAGGHSPDKTRRETVMHTIDFWLRQPLVVKSLLLALCVVAVIAVVRFGRLARQLYRYPSESPLPEDIVRGEADPDLLAASALASRALCKAALAERTNCASATESATPRNALYVLRVAESRFQYLWERCSADVVSTRRASVFACAMSVVMVAYGASPVYHGYHNNSKLTGYYCLFLTAEQLLGTLGFGLLLSAVLYLASGVFERTLAERMTSWKYFCARLKNELSHD
jgi:hypothetical protein